MRWNYHYLLFDDEAVMPLFESNVVGFQSGENEFFANTSVELPSKLNILSDNNFDSGEGVLENGTSISWDEDESNVDTYIVLSIMFDPSDIDNSGIEGYDDHISNNLFLADDGSYSFNSGDIEMFPNNGFVKIYLYRIHFSAGTHEESGKDFAFGSYSCFQMSGKINN